MIDRVLIRGTDRPLDRADDAGRHRAVVAKGVPDGDHGISDVYAVRVGEDERRQSAGTRVHLENGKVCRRVGADHSRLHVVAVRKADLDRPRARDDVVVGDDVAGLVHYEPGAESLLLLGPG